MKVKEYLPNKSTINYMIGIGIGVVIMWNLENKENNETIERLKFENRMAKTEINIFQNYIKQLPNWDSTKFYDWSGGYESGSKWQMAIDDLKENYIHKDSCEFIHQ